MLNVAVCGLRRGAGFTRVFPLFDDCRLSAVCDLDADLLRNFAAHHPDVQCTTTFEDMLETRPDLCVVASPVALHAEQSIAALQAGCHVLQEVFLAETLEQCRQLYDAVQAHPNQKFMLAENCCYWHFVLEWKKMWQAGQLGHLVHGEAEYIHDVRALMSDDGGRPTWRATLPPIHYLTHSLGPLLWISGARVQRAIALATPSRLQPGRDHYDSEVALFQTEDGATLKVLTAFRVAREPAFHYYSLYGTQGCLETQRPPDELRTNAFFSDQSEGGMLEWPLGRNHPDAPTGADAGGHGTAEYYMVRDFLDCIRRDLPPPIDIVAALDMSVPGLCAHQSALENGRPIDLPTYWRA
jgi:predicted dehydrogenase